jgi:hypothetical protein
MERIDVATKHAASRRRTVATKILLAVFQWTLLISQIWLYWVYLDLTWWAGLLCIAGTYTVLFWAFMAYFYLAIKGKLPIRLQKVAYSHAKNKIKEEAKNLPPLTAYPFMVFVEFQMDDTFKKGGIPLVHDEVVGWFAKYSDIVEKTLLKSKLELEEAK